MASRAPTAPPQLAPVPPISPPLKEGFVRLSDVRVNRPAKDEYAALRTFVGKMIELSDLTFERSMVKRKGKDIPIVTGKMQFREYGTESSYQTSAVPQAAVKAIIAAAEANPGQTLVAEVVKLKRGLALR